MGECRYEALIQPATGSVTAGAHRLPAHDTGFRVRQVATGGAPWCGVQAGFSVFGQRCTATPRRVPRAVGAPSSDNRSPSCAVDTLGSSAAVRNTQHSAKKRAQVCRRMLHDKDAEKRRSWARYVMRVENGSQNQVVQKREDTD